MVCGDIEGEANSKYYEVGNPFLRPSWALSEGGKTLDCIGK